MGDWIKEGPCRRWNVMGELSGSGVGWGIREAEEMARMRKREMALEQWGAWMGLELGVQRGREGETK